MATFKYKDREVYLNEFLKKRLDNIPKILKKNWDCVILIDGPERSGKSTLGMTIATYLYPDFSIKNIVRGLEDAAKRVDEAPNRSVLFIDEGSLVFNTKDAMTKAQKQLMKIMDVVGQKNMLFIIVLPSFFDLNKTIAVRRSKFLLHVYVDKNLNRGKFVYYGEKKKKFLYQMGKKNFGDYSKIKGNFIGNFTDFDALGEEYQKVKAESLRQTLNEGKKKETHKWLEQRNIAIKYLLHNKLITQEKLAEYYQQYGHKLDRSSLSKAISSVNVRV